jgi:hypothetical protein
MIGSLGHQSSLLPLTITHGKANVRLPKLNPSVVTSPPTAKGAAAVAVLSLNRYATTYLRMTYACRCHARCSITSLWTKTPQHTRQHPLISVIGPTGTRPPSQSAARALAFLPYLASRGEYAHTRGLRQVIFLPVSDIVIIFPTSRLIVSMPNRREFIHPHTTRLFSMYRSSTGPLKPFHLLRHSDQSSLFGLGRMKPTGRPGSSSDRSVVDSGSRHCKSKDADIECAVVGPSDYCHPHSPPLLILLDEPRNETSPCRIRSLKWSINADQTIIEDPIDTPSTV